MVLWKMHCSGADYLFADCVNGQLEKTASETAAEVCGRSTGIGALGLVLLLYSNDADLRIEIYNSFGEKSVCNPDVLCCAAKFAAEKFGNVNKTLSFDTDSGIKYVAANEDGSFTMNAGVPVTTPQLIPVDYTGESFIDRIVCADNVEYAVTCLSLGDNPFAVIFTEDGEELNSIDVSAVAPHIEKHNIFPLGVNVVFANDAGDNLLQERCCIAGIGEVCGCSFGACAAYTAAWLNKLVDDRGTVECHGGDLKIEISDDDFIYVTAFAEFVFEVEW